MVTDREVVVSLYTITGSTFGAPGNCAPALHFYAAHQVPGNMYLFSQQLQPADLQSSVYLKQRILPNSWDSIDRLPPLTQRFAQIGLHLLSGTERDFLHGRDLPGGESFEDLVIE